MSKRQELWNVEAKAKAKHFAYFWLTVLMGVTIIAIVAANPPGRDTILSGLAAAGVVTGFQFYRWKCKNEKASEAYDQHIRDNPYRQEVKDGNV